MLLHINEENELVKPREALSDPCEEEARKARDQADAASAVIRAYYWKHHGNKDDE